MLSLLGTLHPASTARPRAVAAPMLLSLLWHTLSSAYCEAQATHCSDSYRNYAQASRHKARKLCWGKQILPCLNTPWKSLEMNQARPGMVNLGSQFSWSWDLLPDTPLGRLVRVFHGKITRRGKSFAPGYSILLSRPKIKRSGRNSGFYLSTLVSEYIQLVASASLPPPSLVT